MSDRTGIFQGEDPFAIARAWLDEAAATEPNDPNAIALATVDADGLPDARMVLLKEIEPGPDGGFVFYTNYDSAKGRQIAATGKAAFVMHWKSLRRLSGSAAASPARKAPPPTPITPAVRCSRASAPGPAGKASRWTAAGR